MKRAIVIFLFFSTNTALAVDLDSKSAEQYALYAMMASNTYHKQDRTYFPVEDLGWVRVDLDGNPALENENSYSPCWLGRIFSSLQYDIWVNKQQRIAVIAFKGTDEKIDWLDGNLAIGVSIPYKSAKKHVKNYMQKHPDQKVVVTGHSLGGGLALSVSLWEGVDAYAFNSSPRVFDGFENHAAPAVRTAIYQEGDILQKLRRVSPKFLETVPEKDIIKTNFKYGEESNHRADLLAEGILRCATDDADLAKMAHKLPKKVECTY